MTQQRSGLLVLAGALILAIVVGMFVDQGGLLSTVTTMFMFLALAQAWNILGGYAGYINFGMAGFFGVGAYTTAILFHEFGFSPFLTAVLGGAAAVIIAFVVGVPSLRLRGSYFAIVTLIITFAIQLVVFDVPITQGSIGITLQALPFSPRIAAQVFYFTFLVLAILATVAVYFIERSRFGYALVAIREDEDAADVLGVRTTAVKTVALLIGAGMAGIVGGIYSAEILYIEPSGTFALDNSLNVILIAVVGGAGSWQGALIGAPVILLVADFLRVGISHFSLGVAQLPTEFNRLFFGAVLIAVAIYAPGGIMGLLRGIRGRRFTV
jgi:branched-chain amino acid transport system permease protein